MYPSHEIQDQLWEISGWPRPYTLGYLLRKLPTSVKDESGLLDNWLSIWVDGFDGQPTTSEDIWWAEYMPRKEVIEAGEYSQVADTAEDAAAKLAIELFKQGVLTK